jgi:hypothetical protein
MAITSALVLQVLKPWLALIVATASAEHVDPRTLAAIVFLESRGQPHLVSNERNGTCSVGLGQVNVADCDPVKMSALHDPAYNLRVSAKILKANRRWCRRHPSEWRCRAGERVFKGGGAVNCYAGNTKAYAPRVAKVRKLLPPLTRRRRSH